MQSEGEELFNQDMISKMREVEKFFKQCVRYIVDFNKFPVNNIS